MGSLPRNTTVTTSSTLGILGSAMATYEYVCLACETHFEQRRPIGAAVDTAIACTTCGSDRVRRRFSLFATPSSGSAAGPSAGCARGGACACGH